MKLQLSKKIRYLIRKDSSAAKLLFYLYKPLKKAMWDYKILPLEWMDQAAAHEKGLLCKGENIVSIGPRHINQVAARATIKAPDIFYRTFINARISANSSSVILNDKRCIIERFGGIEQYNFDYTSGHIVMHGHKSAIVRFGKSNSIENGIFLGGNGSYNYYHWLIEIIPKLEFLSSLPEKYRNFPILVNEEALRIPTFNDILTKLTKNNKVIYLEQTSSYIIQELIYIDTPNNLPFNIINGVRCDVAHSIVRKQSIAYLRHSFLNSETDTQRISSQHNRLFLGRKGKLRTYNQEEVENCLAKYGFKTVYMEELSFPQQINTINTADWIVGPTGAAWTNLIFCRAGTKCLCWMGEEAGDFSAFSNIAALVGADMNYITFKTGATSSHELHSKNYNLDIHQIDEFLSQQIIS